MKPAPGTGFATRAPKPYPYTLATVLMITGLGLYRFTTLWWDNRDLFADETYYWGWSKALAFGYYSKPPMVAWLIRTSTELCGDGEICIRTGALVFFMASVWILFLLIRRLFDERTGFYAALALASAPGLSFLSRSVSTDAPLFLFWGITVLAFRIAIETDRWRAWIGAGVVAGLGLMSKYTMVLFPLCAVVYLAAIPNRRHHFLSAKPYVGMAAAFLVFLPNLIWNYQVDFITFEHTAEIAHLHKELVHLDELGSFLGGQFLVFGPVLMGVYLLMVWRWSWWRRNESYVYLMSFSLPVLIFISFQALLSRAFLNWAFPTYFAATGLVVAFMVARGWRNTLLLALAINVAASVVVYHYEPMARVVGVEMRRGLDPFQRYKGWKALGEDMGELMRAHPEHRLVSDERKLLAELVYYVRPHPFDAGLWNHMGVINDHYGLTTTLHGTPSDRFLIVSRHMSAQWLSSYFEDVEVAGEIAREPYPGQVEDVFQVYRTAGFKGY